MPWLRGLDDRLRVVIDTRVDAAGIAKYVSGDQFAAQQAHFREVWANVIPVSTNQIDGLAAAGKVG